jgi:hypothetical protein
MCDLVEFLMVVLICVLVYHKCRDLPLFNPSPQPIIRNHYWVCPCSDNKEKEELDSQVREKEVDELVKED